MNFTNQYEDGLISVLYSPNKLMIWAANLVEMSPFFRSSKGYKYLLTVIDVYSKYGWIVSLKTKAGKEVAQMFRKLFCNGHPRRLWTDKGTEFYN